MTTRSGTVRRARQLVALSAFGPALLFALVATWFDLQFLSDLEMLSTMWIATGVLAALALWAFLAAWSDPDSWLKAVPFSGSLTALLAGAAVYNNSYEDEIDVDVAAYYAVAVLFVAALALLAWLPVLRARRMVMSDLSPEIVDSRLAITFRPRVGKDHLLVVADDQLSIVEDTRSNSRFLRSFPLTDVTSVEVWHEPEPTAWQVEGDEERTLPAGELVGIAVPDCDLVFAPAEPAKVKRFVEARVALARERTAEFDG